MKTMRNIVLFALAISMNIACSGQPKSESAQTSSEGKIQVYYFHFTKRCMTCMAVEKVSKEAVEEFYGNKVNFAGYNLDEAEGEKAGKSLNVSGQTLLIVKNGEQINLTNEGFLYARSNPDKLKQIIKAHIDPLL